MIKKHPSGCFFRVRGRLRVGWDGRVAIKEATGPNVTVDGVTYKLLGLDKNGSKVYQDVEVLKELDVQENNIENSDKNAILELPEALEFNDGKAINDFFYYDNRNDGTMKTNESQYNKWKDKLTEESVKVIRDFTGVGANEINQYLRKKPGWETLNVSEIEKQIKGIDDTIASFVLTESIVVQRGASESALDILFDGSVKELSDLVGKPYRDDGFMSTTALVGNPVATTKPVLFTITIPAGKGRGAYINEFSTEFQDAEYEFLIKRGATFTITEVLEDQKSGKIYVKMVMDVE